MNNQTKRGFSLIEVMILFTVLAVAMASALPLITKKSKPVPRKVAHGVYRCIAVGNGLFLEETYNTFRRLSPSNNYVRQCTFRVPNASLYKVDLYSAGAGGVDYAAYTAEANDARSSVFDMAAAVRYASSSHPSGLDFSNQMGDSKTDMPHTLEDEQIRKAFLGDDSKYEHIIISAYTADAGKGGDASYSYYSPADAKCLAVYDIHVSQYANKMNDAKSAYDAAAQKYNDTLAKYERAISDIEDTIETYNAYQKQLTDLMSTMNGMSDSYNTLTASESTDSDRKSAYTSFKSAALTTYSGAGITDMYYANLMSSQTYSRSTPPYGFVQLLNTMNRSMNSIDKWVNTNGIAALLEDTQRLNTMSGMVTNAGTVATKAGTVYSNISSKISSQETKLKEAQDALDDSLAEGGELYKLAKDRDEKYKLYTNSDPDNPGAKELYNKAAATEENARPEVYNNQTHLSEDKPSSLYTAPEVAQQIRDFCKARFPEFYKDDAYGYQGGTTYEYNMPRTVSQTGGDKGKGKTVVIDYRLDYTIQGVKARYTNRNIYGPYREYPYVKYIGDLYGNVAFNGNPQGYAFLGCNSTSPSRNTCNSKLPDSVTVKNGENNKNDDVNKPVKSLEQDGNRQKIIAKDGKNVERYLAYHTPSYNGGLGSYLTLETAAATGGKGAIVGYEEGDKTYTTGNFTENLAWTTFREKGSTDTEGDAKAKPGENAKLKDPAKDEGTGYVAYELPATGGTTAQEPKIEQFADLWTKSYNLGQPGTQGLHRHVQTPTMGKRCEIHIPQGGPMLDYLDLRRQAIAKSQDINWFIARKAEEEQAQLGASISCYDNEDFLVFHQKLKGGAYNPTLSGWVQPFYWYQGVSSHVAQLGASPYDNPSGIASKWAKVFGGMRTLSSYGVGRPGSGTSVVDRCVVPKGTYEFKTYRLRSTGGAWTEQLLSGDNRTYNDNYDGLIGGSFDCYRLDPKDGTFPDMHVFDKTSEYWGEDSAYYTISHPTEAGGGAIVITW